MTQINPSMPHGKAGCSHEPHPQAFHASQPYSGAPRAGLRAWGCCRAPCWAHASLQPSCGAQGPLGSSGSSGVQLWGDTGTVGSCPRHAARPGEETRPFLWAPGCEARNKLIATCNRSRTTAHACHCFKQQSGEKIPITGIPCVSLQWLSDKCVP